MDRKNKAVLRKIKESGNYSDFMKLMMTSGHMFDNQTLYQIYCAIRNPKGYCIETRDGSIEEFSVYLKKRGLNFVF